MRSSHYLLLLAWLLPACQQQMAEQPYYRPLTKSEFFGDGRSARPNVPGTIARGEALPNSPLLTGLKPRGASADPARAAALVGQPGIGALGGLAVLPNPEPGFTPADYVDEFPFEITPEVLARGRQRFTIFCAVCHDASGGGKGVVVERGYTQPPSYVADDSRAFARRGQKVLLRDVPVGYLFQVATDGFGAMPDYAAQVPPRDRWAIAAYVRVLQFSQHAKLSDLPEPERARIRAALDAREEKR
jgi:mono/diheme cytochrome c family protein